MDQVLNKDNLVRALKRVERNGGAPGMDGVSTKSLQDEIHAEWPKILAGVRRFLQEQLRLKVNEEKSAVDRPWRRKFLGFSMYKHRGSIRIRLAPQTLQPVKAKLRELTRRNRSEPMQERIRKIVTYLRGWIGYYALAETPASFGRWRDGYSDVSGPAYGSNGSECAPATGSSVPLAFQNGSYTSTPTAARGHGVWRAAH